jgi:GNAT superfamily N-acetyltransferase
LIRELPGGYELDDDPDRVDIDAVHAYLSGESYWAAGRPHAVVARLVREAARVLGLYHEGCQAGFCRAVSDGVAIAYLADVYVLAEHRGRGLGLEMVREMVEGGSLAGVRWVLHTGDAHGLYRLVGFGDPSPRTMERLPGDHR